MEDVMRGFIFIVLAAFIAAMTYTLIFAEKASFWGVLAIMAVVVTYASTKYVAKLIAWRQHAAGTVAVVALVLASPVYAIDFVDKVFSGGLEALVSVAVGGLFFILGLFIKKAVAWKQATTEAVQIVMALYKSRLASSPGGKLITNEELDKIITETKEFGTAFASAWQKAHGTEFKPSS